VNPSKNVTLRGNVAILSNSLKTKSICDKGTFNTLSTKISSEKSENR
jgi:hypothetical protein